MESILKISFAVQSVNDTVVSIGSGNYGGITVSNLGNGTDKQYWLEPDTNGNVHLCTSGKEGVALIGTFIAANNTQYQLKAVNFETIEVLGLVGGRPEHRPHAY